MHVYVHVPFCARRCSYCDFAIAVRRRVPEAAFTDLVLGEWARREAWSGWTHPGPIETLYLGGGTPSRLGAEAIERIVTRIGREGPLAADAEVTLEANPEDVTPAGARGWRRAGVTRVSLGVQSFHDPTLRWMHRVHDADRPAEAVRALREAGIANVSVDLIYAVPAALERSWGADLDRALALEPDHLSLYGLTVEEHTPLGKWVARGQTAPPADDRAADEYLTAHARLTGAGFLHYEVSNAARPGRLSRHNLGYWRREPYLGLGPSAHSASGLRRWWNVREWEAYRARGRAGASSVAEEERLSPESARLETLYLGLRTREGVPEALIPGPTAAAWEREGWAERDAGRVALRPEGWLRLDALVAAVG